MGSRKRAPAPDPEFVNSAIYLRLREIAAEFAEVRKLTVEAKAFRIAAERTRTALHKKFHVGNGVYANGLMTAQALAVLFRLAPNADVQDAAERRLVENAVRQGPGWGEFGLMGSKYAYRALSAIGRGDLALHMLVSEDEHAPTRWIGKTGTLWEDRGFGLSKNHVMLGDYAAWAMECVVGFSPASPGFRRINIKPHPIAGLSWAKGETETPYGLLRVEWKTAGGRFSLKLEIPSGTMADVKFPDGKECSVGPGVHEL